MDQIRSEPFAATIEIPYRGLLAYWDTNRLSYADFIRMHRDVAQSWTDFFHGLCHTYDSVYPQGSPDIG